MGISKPILSLYDQPMWESMKSGAMTLQCCSKCATFRYPPSPVCAECLSPDYKWEPVSGAGEIMSWVVFHRQYFEDHKPPYNAVAVRLAEGPIIMTNLAGEEPTGNWIGRKVNLRYVEHAGRIQHEAALADTDGAKA